MKLHTKTLILSLTSTNEAVQLMCAKSQYVQLCKKIQENHINIRFVPNIKTYNNNRIGTM